MSVLVIDAGNSRVKWMLGGRHGVLATADAAQLGKALEAKPQRVLASNVAGAKVQAAIAQALAMHAVNIEWVRAQAAQCGVTSRYADPAQLGSDRWCGLIAARKRHAGAVLVVNAGTTMTVDALSAKGVFLGGVIVPGITLMCESLARGTAQLKRQAGEFERFPGNTGNAIYSGAINACAGAVERMHRQLLAEAYQEPFIVLSGGAVPALLPALDTSAALNGRIEVVDNLVLEGLLEISRGDTRDS